jgi:hypothetical protein
MLDDGIEPRGMVNGLNNGSGLRILTPSLTVFQAFPRLLLLRIGITRSVVIYILQAERPLLILMSLASLLAREDPHSHVGAACPEGASGWEMDPIRYIRSLALVRAPPPFS